MEAVTKYLVLYLPLIYLIRYFLEGVHDHWVKMSSIDQQSDSERIANRRWHKWDVVVWFWTDSLIGVLFYLVVGNPAFILILMVPFMRWFVLDSTLNLLDKRKSLVYLSYYGIDGWTRKRFKGRLIIAYLVKTGCMLLTIGAYYMCVLK